jgi:hypothetical protein
MKTMAFALSNVGTRLLGDESSSGDIELLPDLSRMNHIINWEKTLTDDNEEKLYN